MSESSWVTLLEVNSRLEAEITKGSLEAQGIPAEIFQEGYVHYAYMGPWSTVEVCVPKERLDEAKAWLADYESGKLENPSGESDDEND